MDQVFVIPILHQTSDDAHRPLHRRFASTSSLTVRSETYYRLTQSSSTGRRLSDSGLTSVVRHSPDASATPGSRGLGPCAQCGLRINSVADACHALGYLYHNACFVCCYCQRSLCGKAFFKDQENVYCEDDYVYGGFQQFTQTCFACGHLIFEKILQALGNSYHPGCFRCCVCTECLDGVPFTVDSDKAIYCLPDYHLVHAPRCGACGLIIMPEEGSEEIVRILALNKEFHLACYSCEDCKRKLGDEPENRCYPMTEPDAQHPDRTIQRLLCLNCHLSRVGATTDVSESSELSSNTTHSTTNTAVDSRG